MTDKSENTILYVDDEQANLDGFKYNFRKDYTIYLATNTLDAFELISKHNIKIVLSDNKMPDMLGTEFLEVLSGSHPDIIRILVTAYADTDAVMQAINKGKVYRFITKPWNKNELQVTLDNAFESYDLKQQNHFLIENLTQKNTELEDVNFRLLVEVAEPKKAEEELAEHRDNLEQLVKQRTDEVAKINQDLAFTNYELIAANEELNAINEEIELANKKLNSEIKIRTEVQELLTESENKFRGVIEQSSEGIMIIDPKGKIIECNKAVETIVEISQHEIIGLTLWDFDYKFLPESEHRESLYHSIEQSVYDLINNPEVNTSQNIDGYRITSTGKKKYITTALFPVVTSKGKFLGRIFRDVTQKVKQDEQLRRYKEELEELVKERTTQLLESEERLRTISDNLPGGAIYRGFTKADDTDHLVYASQNITKITGISTEALLGSIGLFFNKIHPDDIRKFVDARHLSQQTLDVLDIEIKYIRNDNELQWLHLRIMYKRNPDNLIWWDGYVIDITTRKLAEKVAEDRENIIRSIQEGIAAKTGEKLFETIVLKLSASLAADFTFIATLSDTDRSKVETLSFCAHGKIIGNISYVLAHTPCELVLGNKFISYKSGLRANFPQAQLINSFNIDGYVGVPLFDSQHKIIGIMVAMYTKAIDDIKLAEQILEIFSSRVGVEMERIKSESALKEREARFRTLFELAPNLTLISKLDGTIIEANSLFEEMTGFSRKELIGNSTASLGLWPEEERTRIYNQIKEFGRARNQEINFYNKKGDKISAIMSVEPVIINGETSLLSTATDISERKKAEEAIQLYSDIAFNMQIALNVFHLTDVNNNDSLLLIKANPAAGKILGIAISTMLGKGIYDVYPQLVNYGLSKILSDVIRTGKPYENEEYRYFSDKGIILFFTVKAFKVPNNCVGVLIEDITRRKKVEKAVLENEERYRALFDNSPNGIHLIATSEEYANKIVSVNPMVTTMLGYSANELNGMTQDEIMRDLTKDEKQRITTKLMAGETVVFETNFYKKNNTYIPVEVSASVISFGDQLYFLGIDRDISERKQMESTIRESERKFKAIFNQTFEMMGILSPKGVVIDANKMLLDFSNISPRLIIGKPLWESPLWGNRPAIIEKLKTSVLDAASDEFVRFEVSLYSVSNQIYLFDFSLKPIKDDSGKVIFLIAEGRDITDIKTAERKLEENVQFLSTLVETIPLPIFYKDTNGNYQGCNSIFEEYTGYKREQLVGKNVFDLFPYEFAQIYLSADNELYRTLKPQRFEAKMPYADGILKDIIFNKAAFTDAEGTVLGLIGAMVDITDRKQAEQIVRESQEKLLNIFNSTNDGILISDFQFNVLDYNQTLLNMVGFKSADEVNKSPIEFVPAEYQAMVMERIEELKSGKILSDLELEIIKVDGKELPIETHSKVIVHGGNPAILTMVRDIAERRNFEKKVFETIITTEEKERERFAGDLHDEVGPLLSSLKMYLSLLAETDDKQKKDYIIPQVQTLIKEAIQSIREISNDLSPHVLNNYGCVAAINSFLALKRDFLHISFIQNVDTNRYNRNMEVVLYRIVKELINNTIKHAAAEKVEIKLIDDESNLKLTYKDDGKGFDIDNTVGKTKGSIGLLNIMSRIKTVDGKFKILSAKGKGFRFELSIPSNRQV